VIYPGFLDPLLCRVGVLGGSAVFVIPNKRLVMGLNMSILDPVDPPLGRLGKV